MYMSPLSQLVEYLNEKASEHRKHPRNIRSSSLLNEGDSQFVLARAPAPGAADAGEPGAGAAARGERAGGEHQEAGARMADEEGRREGSGDVEGDGGDSYNVSKASYRGHSSNVSQVSQVSSYNGLSSAEAGSLWEAGGRGGVAGCITGSTPSASPALRPSPISRKRTRGMTPVALSTAFDPADFDFLEEEEAGAGDEEGRAKGAGGIRASSGVGSRSVSAVRARFVVLKKLESLVAAALVYIFSKVL
jgi:hypothetical protein